MTDAHVGGAHGQGEDRHQGSIDDDRRQSAEPADSRAVEEPAPCVCLKYGYREPARPHRKKDWHGERSQHHPVARRAAP